MINSFGLSTKFYVVVTSTVDVVVDLICSDLVQRHEKNTCQKDQKFDKIKRIRIKNCFEIKAYIFKSTCQNPTSKIQLRSDHINRLETVVNGQFSFG